MIASDLCQSHYQNSLNIYQENFIVLSAQIVNLNLAICLLKIYQLIIRCFECKKNYQKDFDKDLINRFANTYIFCNEEINEFIFLLDFILMNTWTAGKDLMKHCLIRKLFTANHI